MKYLINIACLVFCTLLLNSCIKEGLGNCPDNITCNIRVVIDKQSGASLADDSDIKHIDLYVFDNDGYMIDKIDYMQLNKWLRVDYPSKKNLQFVAVANVGESVVLSTENIFMSDHISDCSIILKDLEEFKSSLIYQSPDDIFWGIITMSNNGMESENIELPVNRIVSSLNLKVKGIPEYTMHLLDLPYLPDEDDFRFIVETRQKAINFFGNGCGTTVRYGGNITKSDGICELSTFNMFSSVNGEEVKIYIYYKDILVDLITEAEVSTRNSGVGKLLAYNGKLLEIFVSYQSGLQVILQSVNWWGNETLWKDF